MSIPVTLIPGDTTGPEICKSILPLFRAAGADIAWRIHTSEAGEDLELIAEKIRNTGVALMAYHW